MRYRSAWTYLFALLVLTLPSFASVAKAQPGPTYANTETRVAVEQMVEAHGGLARWRAAPTVSYDNVFFNPFSPTDSWWVDRETTQQSTRHTYQSWPIDGATLAYDGETTWTHGWNRANNPRFMAHFFYYFVNLPWLTQDAGVQLGPAETGSLPGDDTRYITVAMTFAEAPTVGKTAGDSYRLFIHPETHLLKAYEYTIGWGPMLDGMNVPPGELFGPTLRVHDRFSTVDGLTIPAIMRTISSDGSQTFGHHAILNPSFSRPFDEARLMMPAGSVVDAQTGLRKPATPASSDPTPFPTLAAAEPPMSGVLEECDLGGPDVGSRCGVFRVPLNHEVDGGPTLDLSFVILTTADSPSEAPVVLLPGGPGDPPTTFAAGLVGRFGSLMTDRELLIMDPRGTGRSGSLSCGTGSGPPPLVATPLPEERVRRCLERWKDQTDLTQYTSKATVHDLEALREWLGYERIFLASYSYGTRVAQVYLREAPEAIAGAVLNGIVPMDTPVYVEMGRNLDQKVAQILGDCRKNTECSSEYPEVEVMLQEVLDDLDQPIEVAVEFEDLTGTVEFTRQRFGYALRGLLYGRPLELPKTIADVHGGDWSGLAQLHAQRLRGIWANYAMAHHLSVLCREDIRRTTQADAESRNQSGIMGAELISGYHAACRQWPGGVLPAGESAAVTSDLPVLLLSGEYDPATPAAWAESIAVHFPNSLQVTIPGQGHFVGGECVSLLQAAFFKAASVDGLDVSCSKEARPAFALRN